jgi:2-keto-4-pentenoate hydratase/2-oxohepta-3-ene-1,7-dioic acid hydratase in catechol pathway
MKLVTYEADKQVPSPALRRGHGSIRHLTDRREGGERSPAPYGAGRSRTASGPRVGVVEGEYIVDVEAALALLAKGETASPKISAVVRPAACLRKQAQSLREASTIFRSLRAAGRVVGKFGAPPRDMIQLLERGEKYRKALGTIAKSLAEAPAADQARKRLLIPLKSARLRAPISRPNKITCVGLNYADHAHEQGIEPPARPIFFLKSCNTICGAGDAIVLPPNSRLVDYEAELAVVIGKTGRSIPEEKAYDYVAGYMILNDVTARDMQRSDRQWYRGKSCDTFAPVGPWLVTPEEIPDPHNLRISLTLNGQTMQDSNTRNLLFKIPYLISYLSQSLTWEVGDVISTGTPAGVGVYRQPPVLLKPGDLVSITVERIGTLTNPVVGP